MKTITKYMLWMLVLVSISCTKLGIIGKNEFGSKLEREGDLYISSFYIDSSVVNFSNSITEITSHLTSQSNGAVISNVATLLEHSEGKTKLTMHLPEAISDGDYLLRFTRIKEVETRAVPSIGEDFEEFEFLLTIEDIMVRGVSLSAASQSSLYGSLFQGEGTSDKPYLVHTSKQFDDFIYAVSRDSELGKGLYFRQERSFDAPAKSDNNEGSMYAPFEFAGKYDGSGHTITHVSYIGGDSDNSNIGLFSILHDGAKISNLSIDVKYKDVENNCGGLAGKCMGKVTIENVRVEGSIENGKNNLGGLIGEVSSSDLTIKDCRIGITISGVSNIGGFVGTVNSGSNLMIDGASNMNKLNKFLMISFTGSGENVGGVVGFIESSYIDIENVKLKNSVSKDDDDIKHIWSANGCVGGVVGLISENSAANFNNIEILTPVYSGGDNIGGLVGSCQSKFSNNFNLIIGDATFASVVNGINNVGGFLGYAEGLKKIYFRGANKINQDSGGYLKVSGQNNVGGVIGFTKCDISFADSLCINIDVSGDNNVGGCIGSYGSGTLNCMNFVPSSSMTVDGNSYIGGLVGRLYENGKIEGGTPSFSEIIDKNGFIPNRRRFENFSNFPGTVISAGGEAGGIVGFIGHKGCELKNLTFTGTVKGEKVGGIVGYINVDYYNYIDHLPYIYNCMNLSHKITGGSSVGGIVGEIVDISKIEYCANYADINSSGEYVAGIVAKVTGLMSEFTYKNLINIGNITGAEQAAGIIAKCERESNYYNGAGVNIYESANYGDIQANGGYAAAGILAEATFERITIEHCANHGDINTAEGRYSAGIAGIIGYNSDMSNYYNVKLTSSCNRGTISSDNRDAYLGGIIARQGDGERTDEEWGTHDCYNAGIIETDHKEDTGGILGNADHHVHIGTCINIGKVKHGNGVIGTHANGGQLYWDHIYSLRDSALKTWHEELFDKSDRYNEETFKGFDFNKVWAIDSNDSMNDGYPYLRNCPYQSMTVEN